MTVLLNARTYDWPTWFLGIMRSFISGGSSAMVAGLTSMGIAPGTFNLNNSLGNTFKLMGVMFLFQGGYRMFEFLQLHGAPDQTVTTKDTTSIQPQGDGVKVTKVTEQTVTTEPKP